MAAEEMQKMPSKPISSIESSKSTSISTIPAASNPVGTPTPPQVLGTNRYIAGYTGITFIDKTILNGNNILENKLWQSDWEKDGEKKYTHHLEDTVNQGAVYTEDMNLFKYSLNEFTTLYEDPTFLSFNVSFNTFDSPLFDYGDRDLSISDESGVTKATMNSSVLSFIDKYSTIPEIGKRKPLYYHFINVLNNIFPKHSTEDSVLVKTYFINSITGMEKLAQAKMVKYGPEGDKITIELNESVGLTTTYLAELYNNLIYSYKTQRYAIPENCLRFDLTIQVTDIRIFKDIYREKSGELARDLDGNLVKYIQNEPPSIYYTLHDCNFDFTKSTPFDDVITNGGFATSANVKPAVLSFDIKYKSVSREFKGWIFNPENVSLRLSSHLNTLVNNKILTKESLFSKLIPDFDQLNENQQKFVFSNSKNTASAESQENQTPVENKNQQNPDLVKELNTQRQTGMLREGKLGLNYVSTRSGNTETYNVSIQNYKGSWFLQDYADEQVENMQEIRLEKMTDGSELNGLLYTNGTKNTVNVAVDKFGNSQELGGNHTRQDYDGNTTPHGHKDGPYSDSVSPEEDFNNSKSFDNPKVGKKTTLSIPKKKSLKEGVNDWTQGVGAKLKQTALDNVDAYKDKLLNKYREIRGSLISDILRQIREPLNLPEIYPDNVYSSDFRSLSLETFAKGLGSELLNDVFKSIPR